MRILNDVTLCYCFEALVELTLLHFDPQYMLKLPEEAKLELLKASVARRTGLPMKRVGWLWGSMTLSVVTVSVHLFTASCGAGT